eukprot:TRINITY_DN9265_c0_g1_i1.p1 TRINITY_DN9265_c0_g1~~TRINITY_DN9265_c0_g1_i1.p1  ORF type:complete len:674 (+),score=198.12 TRINITY_DN9265_c0_g1_i1:102-2024(+)
MEKAQKDQHAYERAKIKEIRAIHKREIASAADAATSLKDETAVWKDLLPGYKIRELSEGDKQQMKSAEVRGLESVEQTMLQYYRKFLGNLVGLAHKRSEDIQHIVVSCLCDLLPQAQEFNFGSSVIDIVVDRASSRNLSIAGMCVTAVRHLLSQPTASEAVLTCLQCIADQVKERGELVSPRLVASLLYVRVKMVNVDSREVQREKQERERRRKQDKKLAGKMEAADAENSRVKEAQLQTNILQKVITTYLRILNTCRTASRFRQSMLLGPTMEGLAKFAHLIDYSLFDLLLQAIRQALDSPATTLAAVLHGIITVSTLAEQHQQNATSSAGVSVDISSYYEDLYRALPEALDCSSHHDDRSRVDVDRNDVEEGARADSASTAASTRIGKPGELVRNTLRERTDRSALAIRACEMLLLRPRRLPLPRVAAFTRRLGLLSAHCPPHVCVSVLALVRAVGVKYPRVAEALRGDDAAASSGSFRWDTDMPDHANALESTGWEMCLLPKSFHPLERDYAAAVLKDLKKSSQQHQPKQTLLGVDFNKAVREYDVSSGGFSPLPPSANSSMQRRRKARAKQDVELADEPLPDYAPPPAKRPRTDAPAAAAPTAPSADRSSAAAGSMPDPKTLRRKRRGGAAARKAK